MLGWEFPPDIVGGLGTACAGLTGALDRLGHAVTFVMPVPPRLAGEADAIARAGPAPIPGMVAARLVMLPLVVGSAYLPAGSRGLAASDPVEAAARYARLTLSALRDAGPFDIVHAHDWLTFAAGAHAATWLRTGWVAHVHSLEVDRAGAEGDPRIAAAERAGLAAAPAAITVSRRERAACVRHAGAEESRVRVVHNGVDGEFIPPRAREADTPPTVLFLGRLTAQKGPSHFLRAACILAGRRPEVRFVMAGEGDQAAALRKQAEELGLSERVRFAGFLRGREWSESLRTADCLVMTSVAEPFGIAALEAVRHGTAAIVPPDAGVAEVVPALPTCDPRRSADLAEVIGSLLTDPAARIEIVRQASRQAAGLTWEVAARACVEVHGGVRSASPAR